MWVLVRKGASNGTMTGKGWCRSRGTRGRGIGSAAADELGEGNPLRRGPKPSGAIRRWAKGDKHKTIYT